MALINKYTIAAVFTLALFLCVLIILSIKKTPTVDIPGYKLIQHNVSKKCLDSNVNDVYFNNCQSENNNQVWKFQDNGLLKYGNTDKCLDNNGTTAFFHSCDSNNNNQKWIRNGNLIKNNNINKCLDSNGRGIYLNPCNSDNIHQAWNFNNTI